MCLILRYCSRVHMYYIVLLNAKNSKFFVLRFKDKELLTFTSWHYNFKSLRGNELARGGGER